MTTGTERSSVLGGRREEKARSERVAVEPAFQARAFQARAATTGNDRSPRVERRVDGTSRVDVPKNLKTYLCTYAYPCSAFLFHFILVGIALE